MNAFDISLFRWFNSWAGISHWYDSIIIFKATYLWYVVLAAVVLFPLVTYVQRFRGYRGRNAKLFWFALVSFVVARYAIVELIYRIHERMRPFAVLPNVVQLVDHARGHSFPSGHAAAAFAVATAVAHYYPKTSILFFVAALSIGLGRVAAGVHWPSDILGGALVGIGTAIMLRYTIKKLL